ncbi:MBL fold metallo-hydrolase [Pseudooceanicola algae]|uniref:Hydroxyacylglutathione hydrolase n=1 Tax=Pseudooceanicola algae TaxID=1537215 RepID=A0A418SEB6_9RHOB|nr:MBL fold metallo-hydrolase [Pseudooceanicola algae]QPM89660.1 Hydroxyacylglutathione hydrolase [Pseudooceanicola algae]
MDMAKRETPVPGQVETLRPGLRRLLASNPSPFTGPGTNSYLLGTRDIAVIDPGPDDPAHLQALLGALEPGQRITHILVTHAHLDHSPLARPLANATGAPILAYGDAEAGRSAIMQDLAARSSIGGGEGVDSTFVPDIEVPDNAVIVAGDQRLRALWTPGHFGNHLCFDWDGTVFTGDLVMGWATSLVSPPDGDLTDFMASCRRLRSLPANLYLPGHGAEITDPHGRLDWLLQHRTQRETDILEALAGGPAAPMQLAERIYSEVAPALLPAAMRNVLAHLIDLTSRNLVEPLGPLQADADFRRL